MVDETGGGATGAAGDPNEPFDLETVNTMDGVMGRGRVDLTSADMDQAFLVQDPNGDVATPSGLRYRHATDAETERIQQAIALRVGSSLSPKRVDPKSVERASRSIRGCLPASVLVLVVAVIAGLIGLNLLSDDEEKKTTTAAGPADPSADSGGAALDGHWVLVDGLKNTYADMGLSCSNICDKPDGQLTIDKPSLTIDISGTTVTGGVFKTGYSTTFPRACDIYESRVDATVSGNVDPAAGYGQLIVDGTEVRKDLCDSNHQPRVTTQPFHTSRYFFLRGHTLVLCYNIDPKSFDACTTAGFSEPQRLGDGTAATLERG